MKSINERIKDNQDFYNGVAVGVLAGTTFTLLFIVKTAMPPVSVGWGNR